MTAVCQQPSSLSHFWRDSSLQIEIESCYYSFHRQTGLWWRFTIQITTRESHRGKFHRGRGLECKTLLKEKQNVSPRLSCSVVCVQNTVHTGVIRQGTHSSPITTDCVSVDPLRTLRRAAGTCCAFHLSVLFFVWFSFTSSFPQSASVGWNFFPTRKSRLCAVVCIACHVQ